MQSLTLTLPAAVMMGFAFGAGPCAVTCLPYIGPLFVGRDGGRAGWRILFPFSLGRLSGYALLGAVAGGLGYAATGWVESRLAHWWLGGAALLLGLLLLRGGLQRRGCSTPGAHGGVTVALPGEGEGAGEWAPRRRSFPLGTYLLGAGLALNPCIPLGMVLTVAAAVADPLRGASLGLAFGIGAVVVPTLLFSLLLARLGNEARQQLAPWRRRLEQGAGGLLVAVGLMTLFGWIQP